jgi:Ca2+-binding RTX toxin-like protein
MPTQLWTTTPTAADDFLIGSAGNNVIDGGSGDDYIIGDSILPFLTGTSTDPLNPANIDNSAKWTTDENPFVTDFNVPYTQLYVTAVAGQKAYSSVTIGAGETITIDIDFGIHPIGSDADLMVILLDANGNPVANNDDHGILDPGSQNTWDSYLTYTNNTGSTQTFTIVFQEFGDDNNFEGGETFVADISVTGHSATGSAVPGNDTLTGGIGDDTIAGQGGADTLSGGDGADTLFGGSGNDSIDGGTGLDTAGYSDATAGVNVNLIGGTATGGAGNDALTSIENLIGSRYNDNLSGDDSFNTIRAGSGNDTVYGLAGFDQLYGEDGDDTIYGGDDSDVIYGDNTNNSLVFFNNTLVGGGGNDSLYGWHGNDTLFGNEGNDSIVEGGGDDTISGGTGVDWLYYNYSSGGPVTVNLGVTTAQNTGGGGIDTISGIENLYGTGSNDTLTGTGGANTLEGAYGNDVLNGGAGNDLLLGDDGDDTINGGGGNDTASYTNTYSATTAGVIVDLTIAGAQNTANSGMDTLSGVENLIGSYYDDQLSGTGGNNRIEGGNGNDVINGRGGDDTLKGDDGNDTLIGGTGNDVLGGGNGNDTASYFNSGSAVTVNLATAGAQNTVGSGFDTLAGIENLTGSNFDDTLTGNGGVNILTGGGGDDTLTGGAAADQFVFNSALNVITNVDSITDFQHTIDKIELDHTIFGAAGADGTLAAAAFYSGAAAHDATDRIIYDSTTGNIYYDADGNGGGGAILFAHVDPGTTLNNSDFEIFG